MHEDFAWICRPKSLRPKLRSQISAPSPFTGWEDEQWIKMIRNDLDKICSANPNIAILKLGSNDLWQGWRPWDITLSIVALAELLLKVIPSIALHLPAAYNFKAQSMHPKYCSLLFMYEICCCIILYAYNNLYSVIVKFATFMLQCLAIRICVPCLQHNSSGALFCVFSSWVPSLPLS